jgi:hypothetical protein
MLTVGGSLPSTAAMTFAISHCTARQSLRQAGVRYRWDGEETVGMLERSNPLDKIF